MIVYEEMTDQVYAAKLLCLPLCSLSGYVDSYAADLANSYDRQALAGNGEVGMGGETLGEVDWHRMGSPSSNGNREHLTRVPIGGERRVPSASAAFSWSGVVGADSMGDRAHRSQGNLTEEGRNREGAQGGNLPGLAALFGSKRKGMGKESDTWVERDLNQSPLFSKDE